MAEYHVGCGIFGDIYAGTFNKPSKNGLKIWRNKSEVTKEAIHAVVQHFAAELKIKKMAEINAKFTFRDGKKYKLNFSLIEEESDG